jgi:hypothetical protein
MTKGRAVLPGRLVAGQPLALFGSAIPPLCHPDRNVVEWRDLRFVGPFQEMFFGLGAVEERFSPPAIRAPLSICRKRSDQLLWCHMLVTRAPAHELPGT